MFHQLRSRWLLRWVMQGAVLLLCAAVMFIFISSISAYYEALRSECLFEACQYGPAPPTTLAELAKLHLTADSYAALFVIMDVMMVAFFYIAAGIVFVKNAKEPMGLLAVLMLVSFGSGFPSVIGVAGMNHTFVFALGWGSLVTFFFLFPDGRFVPRWGRFVAIPYASLQALGILFPASSLNIWTGPIWLRTPLLFIPLALMVTAQIYRFRHAADAAQRQQTKWVVYGFALSLAGFIAISALYSPQVMKGAAAYLVLNSVLNLCLCIIPAVLTIAILRHRLWDIDPLVNRTLLYGGLLICIIGIYSLVVTYLSELFHTPDNRIISLLAAAVVAVLFAPMKERLHRVINRMMYGRVDEPFAVLTELSMQWEKPMEVTDSITVVVHTIRNSLRLPYTRISVPVSGAEPLLAAAGEWASGEDGLLRHPVVHRGESIAELIIAPRSPGEVFSQRDQKLLAALIQQAGPIVQGVRMAAGLRLLAEEAQDSREKLVYAREEERRKLRRNLHDDLAPRLAAIALNAAAAERFVHKDVEMAAAMLGDLRKVIRSSIDEIRLLVHDLRPPKLDELGLADAIRERVGELIRTSQQLSEAVIAPGLTVRFELDDELPQLPAAVEVAAYRIITEAVVNIVRHAQATYAAITVAATPEGLELEVTDNGVGIGPGGPRSAHAGGGVGLQSMREQTAELGGSCVMERLAEGGTRIAAILPYDAEKGRSMYANRSSG